MNGWVGGVSGVGNTGGGGGGNVGAMEYFGQQRGPVAEQGRPGHGRGSTSAPSVGGGAEATGSVAGSVVSDHHHHQQQQQQQQQQQESGKGMGVDVGAMGGGYYH